VLCMYKLRIKFNLSQSTYLGVDESSYYIDVLSRKYLLSSPEEGKKISESSTLILTGTGFETEADANAYGKNITNILRVCSVKLRVGINLGNNKSSGGISDYFRDLLFQETGQIVLNEIDGLMTYEDTDNTKIASVSANAILTKDIKGFEATFKKLHDSSITLSDKLIYAFEFYNLTQFNTSSRIKFLLFIITIESLIEAKERRSDVINHVNHIIHLTKENMDLNQEEKQSLISSLSYLKNESISASGRNIVSEYLKGKTYNEKQASRFFTECYNIRSKLVHNGKWHDEYEPITNELGNMVTDLLISIVERECIKN
jgi:hypothetical protein